jgi:hypothetical protein
VPAAGGSLALLRLLVQQQRELERFGEAGKLELGGGGQGQVSVVEREFASAVVAGKLRAGQGASSGVRADCCDHEEGSVRVAGQLGHLDELLESV